MKGYMLMALGMLMGLSMFIVACSRENLSAPVASLYGTYLHQYDDDDAGVRCYVYGNSALSCVKVR